MNIQEVFNRVIDQRYYNELTANSAMCNSLYIAWCWDVINTDEYLFAGEQIKDYILPTSCAYLEEALAKSGLPNTIEARTAIYRDWANRPTLKHQEQSND